MDLLARFVGIWMVFVIYIAVGVEGAAYGATCTGPGAGDCAEANNECDTTCKCAANFFRKTSPAECGAQVAALDGTCDTAETATDQCAVTDSECRTDSGSDKCLCKTTHYTEGGGCIIKVAALDDACNAAHTASDQCSVTDSECRTDSGSDKCLCKATHFADGASCTIRIKPDETCAANQCVEHATCNTVSSPTKCECDAGYTATPTTTPTMCSGVVKFATLPYMYVVPILVSMMFLLR